MDEYHTGTAAIVALALSAAVLCVLLLAGGTLALLALVGLIVVGFLMGYLSL